MPGAGTGTPPEEDEDAPPEDEPPEDEPPEDEPPPEVEVLDPPEEVEEPPTIGCCGET